MNVPKEIVLVVDDNMDQRTIAAALLTYAGYIVIEADKVKTAEQILRTHSPDLLLLDIQLPQKNGLEWAYELRASPSTAKLPIAIYTSFYDVYRRELCDLEVAVISKSESPQRFLDLIETVLHTGGTKTGSQGVVM